MRRPSRCATLRGIDRLDRSSPSPLALRRGLLVAALVLACDEPAPAAPPTPAPTDAPAPSSAPAERPSRDLGEPPPVRADGTIFADGELMGTHVSINLWLDADRTATEAGEAMQAAFDEIARLETVMSEWQPTSEISRLNAAAGGPAIVISPELFRVLQRSVEVSELSDGAFDVSFHGVGQLWSFEPGARPPPAEQIAAKLPLVDWHAIELDASTRKARLAKSGMMLGLGAIAKGYAVDRASEVLRKRGFFNHVVEGGGDTYVSGTKAGKPWMVGVQDPDRKGVLGALPSTDISVVTSGDYERYFEFEGKRYAHILDPRTGYPLEASKSCKSVTAVAPNATDADAFATAIAVMGPDMGMAFVERTPDLEAILITRDDAVLISSGLRDRFVWAPEHDPARRTQAPAKPSARPTQQPAGKSGG